jgi:hypothetical protein
MKVQVPTIPFSAVAASLLAISASGAALGQEAAASDQKVQEVIVTGSRIAQTEAQRE